MTDTGLGVKALILNGHDILILVKHSGVLDLPGGRIEYGENQKEALDREIIEETGLIVKIHDPIAHWSFTKSNSLQISGATHLCQYLGGRIRLSDEHSDYFWFPLETIDCSKSHLSSVAASKLKTLGLEKYIFSHNHSAYPWRCHVACKKGQCRDGFGRLAFKQIANNSI